VSVEVTASGIFNLNKPSGPTSFKIVRDVRRLTGQRRIGHGGTLDPMASGILPILVGAATRLTAFVHAWSKTYRALLQFGATSNTYDAEGQIQIIDQVKLPTAAGIEDALPGFMGSIQQKPPAFSAIKLGGEPLYRKARRGEPVQTMARMVEVSDIRLISLDEETGECRLQITGGKGLYVRSLAHDLGQQLGCGAYLKGLTRTEYGPLKLADSITLEQLEASLENWSDLLMAADLPLRDWPALCLDPERAEFVRHGRPFEVDGTGVGRLRLLDANGKTLLGWGELGEDGLVHPRAVFTQ
jgi:tRNA pseudouridine55 synthase